jgi:hypothetical protein
LNRYAEQHLTLHETHALLRGLLQHHAIGRGMDRQRAGHRSLALQALQLGSGYLPIAQALQRSFRQLVNSAQ